MRSKSKLLLPRGTKVPRHIAIVLDGNRRWARARGLATFEGHNAGFKAMKKVVKASREMGVHTLTVWGFSTENWDRSKEEIKKIMDIVRIMIGDFEKDAKKEDIRIVHLGRKDRLPEDIIRNFSDLEKKTMNNKRHVLNVALDYGGRDEIIRAVRGIVQDEVPENEITDKLFEKYLDTHDQPYPNPDLFIRPSGEQRTSGLLPWQMVYSEYYWEVDPLPDFTPEKLKAAILDFSRRRRRFGGNDVVEHFKFSPQLAAKLEINWWRLRNIPEGTKFSEYAIDHLREQFGLSKELAKSAAVYMTEALVHGSKNKWVKALSSLKKFYKLIKNELKLAFEPSLAASLEVKLWKDLKNKENSREALDVEETARQLYAEVYRISLFQAAKAAHLRVLAAVERNLAERGMGEHHWARAEDYLQKFYSALKERVA